MAAHSLLGRPELPPLKMPDSQPLASAQNGLLVPFLIVLSPQLLGKLERFATCVCTTQNHGNYMPTEQEHGGTAAEKKHGFTIFIDAVKYQVDKTSMTGAEIKALAHIDANYQLYLEEHGDQPDKPISDMESVAIKENMHFYAIPPATMGLHFHYD